MIDKHSVWQTRVALKEVLEKLGESRFWPYSKNITENFDYNSMRLAIMIIGANGDIHSEEVSTFNYIFDTNHSYFEFARFASELIPDDILEALTETPDYFLAVADFDKTTSQDLTQAVYNYIKSVATIFTVCSGEVGNNEVIALSMHLKAIKSFCEQHSLSINDDFLPGISIDTSDSEDEQQESTFTHAPEEARSMDELILELNSLTGLERVKSDVNSLANLIKVRKLREEKGFLSTPMSLHLVFTGNPGTGKTTVARLLGKIYKSLGVLSSGHLVEVDRSGLVAGYVGQTALKTKEVAESAKGGILFIDEAYTLSQPGGENDYGREAIETLLKFMEDNRNDFIIIAAGYNDKMQGFLSSNPGLRSRFNKFIHFDDYSSSEMRSIFLQMVNEAGYSLANKADNLLRAIMDTKVANKGEDFANGREARNLFEYVVSRQADRVVHLDSPTEVDLSTIIDTDFPVIIT